MRAALARISHGSSGGTTTEEDWLLRFLELMGPRLPDPGNSAAMEAADRCGIENGCVMSVYCKFYADCADDAKYEDDKR